MQRLISYSMIWAGTGMRSQALIFVSQSMDYIIPASSPILQDRLGLPKTCMALDIGLGCSGFVYGLSIIGSLMSQSKMKKALLLGR